MERTESIHLGQWYFDGLSKIALLLIFIFFVGCGSGNSEHYCDLKCSKSKTIDLENFDQYTYRNDSFTQEVYIYQYSKGKQCFYIKVLGLNNNCIYEFADTATCQSCDGLDTCDPGVISDDEMDDNRIFAYFTYDYSNNDYFLSFEIEAGGRDRLILEFEEKKKRVNGCCCKMLLSEIMNCTKYSKTKQYPL